MFLVLFIIEDTFVKFSFLQEESQESQPPEDLNEMEAIEVELPEEAAEAAVEPVNHLPRGKKPGKWGKKLRKCHLPNCPFCTRPNCGQCSHCLNPYLRNRCYSRNGLLGRDNLYEQGPIDLRFIGFTVCWSTLLHCCLAYLKVFG